MIYKPADHFRWLIKFFCDTLSINNWGNVVGRRGYCSIQANESLVINKHTAMLNNIEFNYVIVKTLLPAGWSAHEVLYFCYYGED